MGALDGGGDGGSGYWELDAGWYRASPHEVWYRASQHCSCPVCGREYGAHPMDPTALSWDGYPVLHVLCNGDKVKL